MRDALRDFLNFSMTIFLVAGCVQNIYFFEELAETNKQYNHYQPSYYNHRSSSTYYGSHDNAEEENETSYEEEINKY